MNWKQFLSPSFWKIAFTFALVLIFSTVGFVCQPTYADFSGGINTCGSFAESVFFAPLLLALTYPIAWILYFISAYVITCVILALMKRKTKTK